jgi:hypothetical protein
MLGLVSLPLCAWLGWATACGTGGGSNTGPSGGDASLPPDTGPPGNFTDGSLDAIPPKTLYFVPPSATVMIDGTGTAQASYTLEATDSSGHVTQVQADSVQFDRPDLATVTPNEPVVATAPSSSNLYGGTGTIHALYRGVEATATLTVQVHVTVYGPGLGATSPSVVALNGSNLGQDPAPGISPLLYPYDATVWPLGLTSPQIMWNAPEAADVYGLHYAEKNYTVDAYYPLPALPGQLRLDQGTWDRLTASNDAASSVDPLAFTLSRWDSVAKTAYVSSKQTWTIAPESLRGAIYYWTASQNAAGVRSGHISRFLPGTGATPQPINNGKCMGCHAVNAQGTVLVGDIDDMNAGDTTDGGANTDPSVAPYGHWTYTRPWASFDLSKVVADAAVAPTLETNKYGADVALTPDGLYVVFGGPTPVVAGQFSLGSPPVPGSRYLSLARVSTGDVIATSGLDAVNVDTGLGMMMPAFSPDGTKLAVVQGVDGLPEDNVIPLAASPDAGVSEYIAYLDFDETGPSFAPTLHTVVDGSSSAFGAVGRGLAYPSFTPDSTAIAYHAGTTSTGCNATCDDSASDDGNLFITGLQAGTPIRMAAACDPPVVADKNASVEPTFNPIQRGGYSWVVFTSMRQWGNVPWPADVTAPGHVNGKRRLWLAAVDPKLGTVDPSHPAIYLDGQEDRPNMRGFFTLSSCVATSPTAPTDAAPQCTAGFECCSGFCAKGQCITVSQVACVGVGKGCMSTAECCNPGTVSCVMGTCQVPNK